MKREKINHKWTTTQVAFTAITTPISDSLLRQAEIKISKILILSTLNDLPDRAETKHLLVIARVSQLLFQR